MFRYILRIGKDLLKRKKVTFGKKIKRPLAYDEGIQCQEYK